MKTKKELKEAYKQMKIPMGVFQVKNVVTNRVLIDNSLDMASKWNRHKMELKFGNHRNRELQREWNENGEENFIFEVLSELNFDEDKKIDFHKELKMLQEMIIEDMGLTNDSLY